MRTRFASLRAASFLLSRDGLNPHFAYVRGSGHGGRRYLNLVLRMNQAVSRLYAYERREPRPDGDEMWPSDHPSYVGLALRTVGLPGR